MFADDAYDDNILHDSDKKLISDDEFIVNSDLSHTLEPTSVYKFDKDREATAAGTENVSNNAAVSKDKILPQLQKQKGVKRKTSDSSDNCLKVQKLNIDNRTCKNDGNHSKPCTRSRLKSM